MFARVIPPLHALVDLQILGVCGLGCRWASRDVRLLIRKKMAQPGSGPRVQEPFNVTEDLDTGDVEDMLSDLERQEKRRRTAIKFQRLRKQFDSLGTPERRLTWDAMEQIRYLREKLPEEWTVARLAEGFAVSTDVIHRVLRSRFIPSPERRAKQDSKALTIARQQSPPADTRPGRDRPQLPESRNSALPAGAGSALATLDQQSFNMGRDVATTVPSGGGDGLGSLAILSPHSPVWSSASRQELQTERQPSIKQEEEGWEDKGEEEEEEDDWDWDGTILSDQELEDLARTLPEQNSQVVQKGTEFFDSSGNFLYRI